MHSPGKRLVLALYEKMRDANVQSNCIYSAKVLVFIVLILVGGQLCIVAPRCKLVFLVALCGSTPNVYVDMAFGFVSIDKCGIVFE